MHENEYSLYKENRTLLLVELAEKFNAIMKIQGQGGRKSEFRTHCLWGPDFLWE